MTDDAIKKIGRMYDLFGHCENREAICRDCDHLKSYTANRKYYKCECYGDTSSEATDWRVGWIACGLYNKPYEGDKPVIEAKKHARRKKTEEPMEGQMSLF